MTEIIWSPNNMWLHPVGCWRCFATFFSHQAFYRWRYSSLLRSFSWCAGLRPSRQWSVGYDCARLSWDIFIFLILIVYLQNRFQQFKSIYGLMEKAAVGGFLASKGWEYHQRQRGKYRLLSRGRARSTGEEGLLTEVFALFQRTQQCLKAARLRWPNTLFQFCAQERTDSERQQMSMAVCVIFSRV